LERIKGWSMEWLMQLVVVTAYRFFKEWIEPL
jgi:hypothetical protein